MAEKRCRRCLLEELGEMRLLEQIRETVRAIPEAEKASPEVYLKRLEACKRCSRLNEGTCAECGCYVEVRAAYAGNYCPLLRPKWDKA